MTERHHETDDEATEASNTFLDRAGRRISRLFGHVSLTMGTEFFSAIGSLTMPIGVVASIATANPVPFMIAAIPSALGWSIGWQGVKNASFFEKSAYLGIKAAATFFPTALTIGLSMASTFLGMRKRQ